MKRSVSIAILAAAAAAGGYVFLPADGEPGYVSLAACVVPPGLVKAPVPCEPYFGASEGYACEMHTLFCPRRVLAVLDGAEHLPAAEDGETVGAVVAVRLPAAGTTGILPTVAPEESVRVVPVETMHPESVAGIVGRHATGEGEWATPEVPPAPGYCYGAGCYCAAEPCEAVAIGAVDPLYWRHRLCRLIPDAPDCPAPAGPETEP